MRAPQDVAPGIQALPPVRNPSVSCENVVAGARNHHYLICSFGGSWPDAHPSHLASAGCATLATGVLPRWTGWVAYTAALANLAAAPSILGGTDYTLFWPLAM